MFKQDVVQLGRLVFIFATPRGVRGPAASSPISYKWYTELFCPPIIISSPYMPMPFAKFKSPLLKKVRMLVPFLLTLLVIYKTFPLKTMSYAIIPEPGITFDEFAFAWMGKSFLDLGMPVSWTTNLAQYKAHYYNGNVDGWGLKVDDIRPSWNNLFKIPKPGIASITYDYGLGDRNIDLVQPYFDHPLLAGIVYSLGIPKDKTTLTDVTPSDFRRVNATLGVITALLLFALGTLLYSSWVGFGAALLYSTMPSTLLSSRLAMAENVTIPFFLATMVMVQLALKHKKIWMYVLAGILAGACTLVKFSGVSVVLATILLLFFSKARRSAYIAFAVAYGATLLPYFVYAQVVAGNLFWSVLTSQSARGSIGFMNLIQALSRVNFSGFPIDGWWAGGLASLFYLMSNKKHLSLSIMALSFVLVATLLGGDNNAWYLFPLGIFICLAWGVVLEEILHTPNIFNIAILFLFGVLSSMYWGFIRINDNNYSWVIRIMAAGFMAAGLLLPLLSKHRILKYLWIAGMVLVIHRLYLWNFRGFQYILLHWGELPPPLMLP